MQFAQSSANTGANLPVIEQISEDRFENMNDLRNNTNSLLPTASEELVAILEEVPPADATLAETVSFRYVIDTKGVSALPKDVEAKHFDAITLDDLVEEIPAPDATLAETVSFRYAATEDTTSSNENALALHFKRGALNASIGSTAFVGVATMNGYDMKETRKIGFKANVDGSGFVFGFVSAIAEGITQAAEHGYADQAKYVKDVVSDPRFWWGIAAVMMATEYIPNKIEDMRNRQAEKREFAALPEDERTQLLAEKEVKQKEKLPGVIATAAKEVWNSEHKITDAFWLVAALGSQAADRARVSVVLVPEVATRVLEESNNSLTAGAAAAAVFMVWCTTVGEAFAQGLHRFPKSVERFADKYPRFVKAFTDAMPGIEQKPEVEHAMETEDVSHLAELLAQDIEAAKSNSTTSIDAPSPNLHPVAA
jgi:hypothetical protein